ncbi:MAG TPA: sulfate transporter family protein [Methylocella sp.]|nr:sulfate transporter family protein [Methylocella sp.]
MINDALTAVEEILTRPFREILLKTLGLTLALIAVAWAGLHKLLTIGVGSSGTWSVFVVHSSVFSWLSAGLSLLGGLGIAIGLAYLIPPVSFLVAGYFFDELAEHVERTLAPGEPPGRALPFAAAMWISIKFAALALAVNLVALILLFVPGINAVAFFGANAYLTGRGYFELAAARFLPWPQVRHLRQRHELYLFAAGLIVAGFLTVPVLNLLTPLFATAFMVRIARRILRRTPGR